MIRSAFALVGLILAFAGMGLFIAIGIWIWSVKAEVNRQTEALSGRANKTLDSAHDAIEVVREIIEKAENDLAATRLEMLTQAPPAINPVIRSAARGASQNLAGSVEQAHGAIVIASEAVVVADAALNVVGDDLELKKMFNLKPEQLDATRTALGKVSFRICSRPKTFSDLLPTLRMIPDLRAVVRGGRCGSVQARGFTDEVCKVVESTRTRVNETKQKVDLWAWRGAVGTSTIAAFGVLGQFFMARFFWRLLRRQSA